MTIYWEQASLNLVLCSPDQERVQVFEWDSEWRPEATQEDKGSWYLVTPGMPLDWSPPFAPSAVASEIATLTLRPLPLTSGGDYLVIYGVQQHTQMVRLILLAGEFTGYNSRPPEWASSPETPPTIDMLYTLVKLRSEAYSRLSAPEKMRAVRTGFTPAGHCRKCGLHRTKHVPHDPVPRPKSSAAEELRAYFSAVRQAYVPALEALTELELLEMEIPSGKIYLHLLERVLVSKLSKPLPVKDRLDRLLEEEDPLGD